MANGLKVKSQTEKVNLELSQVPTVTTERLMIPGIETLHARPVDEIGAVLANVLKSRPGIQEFKLVVGSHIEIKYAANPLNQLR